MNAACFLSEEPNVQLRTVLKCSVFTLHLTPGNSLIVWLSNTKYSCLVKCLKKGVGVYIHES